MADSGLSGRYGKPCGPEERERDTSVYTSGTGLCVRAYSLESLSSWAQQVRNFSRRHNVSVARPLLLFLSQSVLTLKLLIKTSALLAFLHKT